MLKLNGEKVGINHFPDNTILIKQECREDAENFGGYTIDWRYENSEEIVALIYLTKHIRAHGGAKINLLMPYIPNARQDRVKNAEDVFTLKYFAWVINELKFDSVRVTDPHSTVSEALFDNLTICSPKQYIDEVLGRIEPNGDPIMFYPDEGAMKRYSGMIDKKYAFGIKKRDWETGQINGLDVSGRVELIKDSNVLIVDDICSRGGTFYHSAKKLKELGAAKIYLYVTHCEPTVFEGEVLTSGLIERVFTTDSIFKSEHKNITVIPIKNK